MKGKMARIAAGLLAVLLIAGYWLLPGREERSVPSGGGHQKYALEPGDSVSWPWKPAMEDCNELSVYLKGMKKGQGIILTGILTDSTGLEAATATQAISELGETDFLSLQGSFQVDTTYTLTIRAEGEGTISIKGEEDDDGHFQPALKETGIVISQNPVLLYFATGCILLALMPVTGSDLRRKRDRTEQSLVARFLPWGTFLLILGVGLLIDLKKPTYFTDTTWGTWDEDNHTYWVQSMGLISIGGLRNALNSVITWHPGYLPLGVGYNIGEILQQLGIRNSDLPYRCAVIVNTLCYAVMCGLAVKHAPRFKVSFLLAGSIPMMIFQATSMTYDTMVGASILLGTALVMETIEQPERLSAGRAILMTALLSMGTVTKPAYSLVLLSLLMIPKGKFSSGKEKWGFRILALLLMGWCFTAMMMPGAYEDVISGDLRFSDTGAGAQIQGMLADPIGNGLKPVRYFWDNLRFVTSDWLDFWAYQEYGLPHLGDMYLILMLLAAPLCCCGENWDTPNALIPARRISWGLIAFFAELLLIYAQYIASSPVGGAVTGMQSRYFMPLWAPALLALMWPHGIRKRARAAGDVMTAAVFALICWANVENAMIHLANYWLQ